jgi:hypothetical protein
MSVITGVLIVAGIAIVLFALGLLLHFLFHRFGHTRPEVTERRPAKPGRVGRTSEFRRDRD